MLANPPLPQFPRHCKGTEGSAIGGGGEAFYILQFDWVKCLTLQFSLSGLPLLSDIHIARPAVGAKHSSVLSMQMVQSIRQCFCPMVLPTK